MEDNKNLVEEEVVESVENDCTNEMDTESENCFDEKIEDADGDGEEKTSRAEKKKLKKAEAEIAELQKSLEKKESELCEENEKYLRLFAEYDNFRKRSAKEREGIYTDACFEVLTQILPILDNLERAAQFNTGEDAESPMGKGLEMTLKSFTETLAKLGVTEIEALGKTFDPNVHNAVMHIDDENFGENEIVEVFMKGYIKGDKVLRYSMVKVAN